MHFEHILAQVGDSIAVFAEVYREDYQAMCVLDHRRTEDVSDCTKKQAIAHAELAYQRAWEIHPVLAWFQRGRSPRR
jgi:hypothetical protein